MEEIKLTRTGKRPYAFLGRIDFSRKH